MNPNFPEGLLAQSRARGGGRGTISIGAIRDRPDIPVPVHDVVPRLQKCKTRRGEPAGRVERAQDLAQGGPPISKRGH